MTAPEASAPPRDLPTPERSGLNRPPDQFCARCDKPLTGNADRLANSGSMSGAHPDTWLHPVGHPDCRPYPAVGARLRTVGRTKR